MTNTIVLYNGIQLLPGLLTMEALSFAQDFLLKDDDVIIVTYPRSGTHWMIEIVSLILSKGDPSWVQTVKSHTRCLWIEDGDSQKILMDQDAPRLMASHLPIRLFPKSYLKTNPKVIYVIRNPRDVATSIYHISKYFPILSYCHTFEGLFHSFIHGNLVYGSWFDHILGWLTRRDTKNFLLMSYEELHRDLRGSIQKVSQFLGKHLTPEQLDSATQNASFSVMKDNRMSNTFSAINPEDDADFNLPLLRKGFCGDWKNHFTVAQSETFDKIYREKMSSLDPGLLPWSEEY